MKAIYGYTDYSFKYGFLGIFEEEVRDSINFKISER